MEKIDFSKLKNSRNNKNSKKEDSINLYQTQRVMTTTDDDMKINPKN